MNQLNELLQFLEEQAGCALAQAVVTRFGGTTVYVPSASQVGFNRSQLGVQAGQQVAQHGHSG